MSYSMMEELTLKFAQMTLNDHVECPVCYEEIDTRYCIQCRRCKQYTCYSCTLNMKNSLKCALCRFDHRILYYISAG